MPLTRQFIPADDAPPAPCDLNCRWWQRCKDERLACRRFEQFVRHGLSRPPPGQRFGPTREIYDSVFGKRSRKVKCN